MRWRDRLARFMMGRYGTDALNKAILVTAFVCVILSWFVLTPFFNSFGLVLLVLCNIRMFSRNIQARYQENQLYLKQVGKIKYLISKLKYRTTVSKTHHIFKCPQCKQKIRVPRGKGNIMVRCPKCNHEFMKKS